MLKETPTRRNPTARKGISPRQWSTADRWTPPRQRRKDAIDIIAFVSLIGAVLGLAVWAIIDPRTLLDWVQ